jgi:hypothetical protein
MHIALRHLDWRARVPEMEPLSEKWNRFLRSAGRVKPTVNEP